MTTLRLTSAGRLASEASTATRCASEVYQMAERYCVPVSPPWRLSVVGSCSCQKRSTSRSKETLCGS